MPKKIEPQGLDDYFEVITKAVFQAGLSWAAVDKKWDNFRRAFSDFDVSKVAAFRQTKVEKLLHDRSIVCSEAKITGTIRNAKRLLALDKEYNGFVNYLRSFSSYEELATSLKSEFAFLGDLSVYYFLFRTGEKVPSYAQWEKTIAGDHPRMREMIALSRKKDTSAPGDAINRFRETKD